MKKTYQIFPVTILFFLLSCTHQTHEPTVITTWQYDKKGAVSLTYDDSTINHFRIALPMMNEFGFPGTFYLITGAFPDSEHQGEFVGRDVNEIIEETVSLQTNKDNFFERTSAVRYLGFQDVYQYHRNAGQLFESGEVEEAYQVIDEAYERVRNGDFPVGGSIDQYLYDVLFVEPGTELITWKEIRSFDREFHEFGSHTVTHPYLSVIDEANIRYELEKSKEEIKNQLGADYSFSVEGPFGTENERVMEYLHDIYPASRNRMPLPFLDELNRSSSLDPADSEKEYVQWQRGPLTDTPMDLMKSWIDKTANQDNIWLVLVFHGIEEVGWEPKSKEELETYFQYLKEHEEDLWVATFQDVAKYLQQRMNAEVNTEILDNEITVQLTHPLDSYYDTPMTLKTYVPSFAQNMILQQGSSIDSLDVQEDEAGSYVLYQVDPNSRPVILSWQDS